LGRGLIKVLNDYYPRDFKVGEQVKIDGVHYEIRGIEGRTGATGQLKGIGLLVKEVKDGS